MGAPLRGRLPRRRRKTAWIVAVAGPILIAVAARALGSSAPPATTLFVTLLVVVLAALLGGAYPALAAVAAGLLAQWIVFGFPYGSLNDHRPAQAAVLAVFVLIGAGIGLIVDELSRLTTEQAALRRIAALVARGVPPHELFSAVADEVAGVLAVDGVYIAHSEPDGFVRILAAAGRTGELSPGKRLPHSSLADDREHAAEGLVSTPILVEGAPWGVIVASSRRRDLEPRLLKFTELVATAIANAESRQAVATLADEQAALRRVATLVASGSGPEPVFRAVADEVQALFDSSASGILRFEEDGTATTLGTHGGDLPAAGARLPLDPDFVMAAVRRTGRAARFDTDDPTAAGMPAIVRETGVRSTVASPIVVDGQLWGAIAVGSLVRSLPPDTERRLADFTELVATALSNIQAREQVRSLAEEQAALRRVATLVAEGVRPARIFSAVSDEVGRLFGSDKAAVGRFDTEGPAMVVVGVAHGVERLAEVGSRWELDDSLASAQVFRTGRSARVDRSDASSAGGPAADTIDRLDLQSMVASPIVVEGQLWGAITVSSSGQQFPADTEQRLEKFTELVATAIANADSRSKLAASRRRIVAAGDEARRRIERDLHDGIQQRLVALSFRARTMTRGPANQMPGIAAEISEGLRDASEELREVARGIHPAILTEAGLAAALRALARRSNVPVDIDVRIDGRLPAPVEAAAYYIASEGLTNVEKHARASAAALTAATDNEVLTLEVHDDGIGGLDAGRGSGIVGLTDRAEALGGTISIDSAPGSGTTLSVRLPITP
jgi:signal transduction histidine kinase